MPAPNPRRSDWVDRRRSRPAQYGGAVSGGCSREDADEMNVVGFRGEQIGVNGLRQMATLSQVEANC
jgi:hypothetical protein